MTRIGTRLSAGLISTALLVGGAAVLAAPADAASSNTVQLSQSDTVQLKTVQLTVQL